MDIKIPTKKSASVNLISLGMGSKTPLSEGKQYHKKRINLVHIVSMDDLGKPTWVGCGGINELVTLMTRAYTDNILRNPKLLRYIIDIKGINDQDEGFKSCRTEMLELFAQSNKMSYAYENIQIVNIFVHECNEAMLEAIRYIEKTDLSCMSDLKFLIEQIKRHDWNKSACVVCGNQKPERTSDIIFKPCGHTICQNNCAIENGIKIGTTCPTCHEKIGKNIIIWAQSWYNNNIFRELYAKVSENMMRYMH